MTQRLMKRPDDEQEPIYTRSIAAQLAHISLDFLQACERLELIQVRVMKGGIVGFSRTDIAHLARIRRLREELGLDLPAVEIVLNLRQQVLDLLTKLSEQEHQMAQREQALLAEIQQLRRRLAEEAEWRV